ncbi:MAG: O-antigen ligase family protein [Bdellovibrionaceae bacterium]|nr:O-antigen ligase family protein [Pseudobdellovibrionaceae bacterium]
MTGLLFVFLSATLISQSFMDAMSVVIILYMLALRFSKKTQKTQFQALHSRHSFLFEIGFIILWLATVAIGLKDSAHFAKNLWEWKWILNLYFMYWFLNHYLQQHSGLNQPRVLDVGFWQPLYWILLACFGYGAISYASGIDLFKQMPLTHGQRFAGPFDDPMNFAHIYGMYTVFLAPFVLDFLKTGAQQKKHARDWRAHALASVAFACTAVSVYLSLTRGAWIGLFTGVVVIFFVYNWRWGLSLFVAGCLAAMVMYSASTTFKTRVDQALNPSQSYDSERYNLWRSNWEMFKDHPVFGVGHGDYKEFLPTYFEKLDIPADHFQSHAHNQYLHFLSNTGLIGFIFYMTFILALMVWTHQGYRRSRNPVLIGALGAQVAFHMGSLTECNFERAKVRLVYLFFCALALAVMAQERKSSTP